MSTYADTEWLVELMLLCPEKGEYRFLGFLWDSSNHGILYINKIFWEAQGDPIGIFGELIGQQGHGYLYLDFFPHTSTCQLLNSQLLRYETVLSGRFE